MKIVFICTGNTCRSPMAAFFMRDQVRKRQIKGVRVSSSGLYVEENSFTDAKAVAAVKKLGVFARKTKARQLPLDDLFSADLIITMTEKHKQSLSFLRRGEIYTLDELTGAGEIPDPYGGSQAVYDLTAERIYSAVKKLADCIFNQ